MDISQHLFHKKSDSFCKKPYILATVQFRLLVATVRPRKDHLYAVPNT